MKRKERRTQASAHREHQAENVAADLTSRTSPRRGVGASRTEELRGRVEDWAGLDLSHVPVRHNERAGALGSTNGVDISLDPSLASGGQLADHVLLHEFVHAAQVEESFQTDEAGEQHRRPQPLQLFWCEGCGGDTDASTATKAAAGASKLDPLSDGTPLTAAEAGAALKFYEGSTSAGRDKIVAKFHSSGTPAAALRTMIATLPMATQLAKRDVIDDLLRRVQGQTVMATTGQTVDQMGVTQGNWRKAEAEKTAKADAAAAAKAKGVKPPPTVSAADVAVAEKKSVEASSLPPSTTTTFKNSGKANIDAWKKRAATAIDAVVKECTRLAPHLKITKANILFDEVAIEARASGIMAFSGDPITVGTYFVEIAEADPEYAVSTVVHEITGHPEYDDGPEWDIHQASLKTFPTTASADVQFDLYNYLGTEIHSVLREYEYYKPVTAAHAAKGIDDMDPTWILDERLDLIKANYEPSIADALVLGMWDRFRSDPRIIPKSLKLFKDRVKARMPKLKLPV